MRKLVILGAALALGVAAAPTIVSQAQAAPARSPFCSNKYEKGNLGWMQYYHCYGTPPMATRTVHHERGPAKSAFCNNKYEKGNLGWMQYYHCYRS